jgi:DNA-binding transcriptional ArsR family regulator
MREAVRSGRRANFYITENSFIDHYAREVGTTGIAVYHALARHANCETRSTWVGTAKVAELLGVEQRTVQRALKKLESLNLIRIIRSSNMTTYFLIPVPARPKTATVIPLFDQIPDQEFTDENTAAEEDATSTSSIASFLSRHATHASSPTSPVSFPATSTSQSTTVQSRSRDIRDIPYKEEQNLGNNTFEQEYFTEQEILTAQECANRIIDRLERDSKGNIPTTIGSVVEIVRAEARHTGRPISGSVSRITTAWNLASRYGISPEIFLENYIPRILAKGLIENLQLAATNGFISTVAEAVKAEAKRMGCSQEEATKFIRGKALDESLGGGALKLSYFENMKWRNSNATYKPSASTQRSERTKQNILDGLALAAEISRRNQSNSPK